jgi:hypothetical protein
MLLNHLTDLRMEAGSSAQEYVNKFDSLVVDCAALGLGLDKTPELLALFFLRGLPKSLETFAQYLTLSHIEEAKSDGRIIFSRDVKIDETPSNRPRQVTIEVPPYPAETNTGSRGERERRDDKERSPSPEHEQPRSRSTSEERHIAAQRQDDILDAARTLDRPGRVSVRGEEIEDGVRGGGRSGQA